MEKIIFVDRDGVINVDLIGDYIKHPDEFRFEPGAVQALHMFRDGGYKIVIISNQAGVGDGIFTEAAMWKVHRHMESLLKKEGLEAWKTYYCLHGKEAGCGCRKPETGLFEQAARDFTFDRKTTFFIGDKASDTNAGKRFGLKTAFVRTGHGANEEKLLDPKNPPEIKAANLLEAARQILTRISHHQ